MMELNVEEAKTKTLEFLNKKSYSLIRPDFSKYDQVYLFTTENLSYLEKINVQGKDALTVTGSFDQALNLIHEGARKVCNFDTNVNTVFFAKFKIAAMSTFSYDDYLRFFLGDHRLSYQGYCMFRDNLDKQTQEYWDFIYACFSYDHKALMSSRFFSAPTSITNTILSNPYLSSEKDYNETKERLKDTIIEFEEKDILQIGEGEEEYDIMLFSNIESYLVEDCFHTISEEEYIDFIQNKASRQLKDGGVIQMAYQYQYKTKLALSGNFFQRLLKKKYKINRIDYMEGKSKKIEFTGFPLQNSVSMTNDVRDCIYLYEKEKTRHR